MYDFIVFTNVVILTSYWPKVQPTQTDIFAINAKFISDLNSFKF